MPVQQFVHDSALADRGFSNYGGYNTIGFFAPHNDYVSLGTRGQQVHTAGDAQQRRGGYGYSTGRWSFSAVRPRKPCRRDHDSAGREPPHLVVAGLTA